MVENELYILYNILFASTKMHVRFAAALLFFLMEAPSFFIYRILSLFNE